MVVEKLAGAAEFAGLEERQSLVTRKLSRPTDRASNSSFREILVALFNLIMVGSDVMVEAHRQRRDAQRRYPHISFDI
jgi:hypothetical protein